jgi:hypothetical protein
LEEMLEVGNTISAPLENLNIVVEPSEKPLFS